MKRRELKTRRVLVELPTTRRPLPLGILNLLKEAFKKGRAEAQNFIGSRAIVEDLFETTFATFRKDSQQHEGLYHLLCALFFSGLHLEIEKLKDVQEIVSQTTINNFYIAGASTNVAMSRAQLHLVEEEIENLFRLPRSLRGLNSHWWGHQFTGALALSRLIKFLIAEGLIVYLPRPSEDVHWKIDLIAKIPGDFHSLCFQLKSNSTVEWVQHRVLHTKPNGESNEATHRFFAGVRKFQEHHHGIYVPIELSFGSRQFDLGSLTIKGHLIDALRHVINDATSDTQEEYSHAH